VRGTDPTETGRKRKAPPLAAAGMVFAVLGASMVGIGLIGGGRTPAQAESEDKLSICHYDRNQQGPNAGPHVITISANAIDQHLANHVKKEGFAGDDFIVENEADMAACLAGATTTATATATSGAATPTATSEAATPTATSEAATPTATTEAATPTATTEAATPTATTEAATPTATTEAGPASEEGEGGGGPGPVAAVAGVQQAGAAQAQATAVAGVQALPAAGSGGSSRSAAGWAYLGLAVLGGGLGLLFASWRLSRDG